MWLIDIYFEYYFEFCLIHILSDINNLKRLVYFVREIFLYARENFLFIYIETFICKIIFYIKILPQFNINIFLFYFLRRRYCGDIREKL